VIVPARPGALSAFGILVSDVVKEFSRTVLWRVSAELPLAQLTRQFAELSRSARHAFLSEGWSGNIHQRRSLDVRYSGQGYELNVPYSRSVISDFHKAHAKRYGYSHPEREVELVTVRVRAVVKSAQAGIAAGDGASGKKQNARARTQIVPVTFDGKKHKAALYEREQLVLRKKYQGPAIITEYSATSVVPPNFVFSVDRAGNVVIEVR
jgi:N-methylhydantoinase A